MKSINEYNEYGVYNVSDIINSFPDIFNITLPNLTAEFLLTNKKIITNHLRKRLGFSAGTVLLMVTDN